MQTVLFVGSLVLAVLPSLSPERPRTGQLSRAASQVAFQDLLVTEEVQAGAERRFAQRSRLVVLPFVYQGDDADADAALDGIGFMAEMIADLHYVPDYLVVDVATAWQALPEQGKNSRRLELSELARIGRELDAKYLLLGSVKQGETFHVNAQLLDVSGPTPQRLARSQVSGPATDFFALSDAALQELLKQAGTLPAAERVAEMSKTPTRSREARRACDRGFVLLYESAGSPRGEALEISKKALQYAEAALRADPTYLRGYLLQASCLENLGRRPELVQQLDKARTVRDPARVDRLTLLEFDGDYARFRQGDLAAAVEHYEKMLTIDPGHIRGLWSLIETYLADGEAAEADRETLAIAADYAAQLIAAHPNSPMAKFLKSK